jgi:hypothetical protein
MPAARTSRIVAAMLVVCSAVFGERAAAAETLTIGFHLASLPQALRLCDAPDYLAISYLLEEVNSPDYIWSFWSPRLAISIGSPFQPALPCSPYTQATAAALTAHAVRADRTSIPARLAIDYANSTLEVSLDAAQLRPQDFTERYRVETLGHYDDGAGFSSVVRDVAPDLVLRGSAPGVVSVTDTASDLIQYPNRLVGDREWIDAHGFLDLIGVSASIQVAETPQPEPYAIGPGLTGTWYDPAQSGHGLFIEVLDAQRMLVAWFAFAPDGTRQSWFLGAGGYRGDTATIAEVVQPIGGRWIPDFDSTRVVRAPWGSLTLTFLDCNHARVSFAALPETGYGAGAMELVRLTQPAGLGCP